MKNTIKLIALILVSLTATAQKYRSEGAEILSQSPDVYLSFSDASGGFKNQGAAGGTFTAAGAGTYLYQQAGQSGDLGQSASLTYNAPVTAPNTSTGSYEWTHPFSVFTHVDALAMTRTSFIRLPFLTKGTLNSNFDSTGTTGTGYFLFASAGTKFNFLLCASAAAGAQSALYIQSGNVDMANGYGYDILVTWDGSGKPSGLKMYVNGVDMGITATVQGLGLGSVATAISGGTGYATSTAFTSTGGGTNCTVTGTMTSSSGVPASIAYTANYGCTSVPTIVLTSPTGTGVTLTPTLNNTSIVNSYPLVVNGDALNVIANQGTNIHNGSPIFYSEAAVFPTVVPVATIYSLFAHTHFYEQMLGAKPSQPQRIIWVNDGCADIDNHWSLAIAISLQRAGYIKLLAVLDNHLENQGTVVYRQMLDVAGLGHVPIGVGSNRTLSGTANDTLINYCTPTNTTAYNASYPKTWPMGVTVLRTVLAASPDNSVIFVNGGGLQHVYDLLVSTADSISPLSGADLFAAKTISMYSQSGNGTGTQAGDNITSSDPVTGQYYLQNSGKPFYAYGGGIASFPASGPGVPETHTAKDPFGTVVAGFQVAASSTTRPAYDSMPVIGSFAVLQAALFTATGPGTYSITTSPLAMTWSATPDSKHYSMANNSSYGLPVTWGVYNQWFMNSLANMQATDRPI